MVAAAVRHGKEVARHGEARARARVVAARRGERARARENGEAEDEVGGRMGVRRRGDVAEI